MPQNIENPTLSGKEAVDYLAVLVKTYEEGKPDMNTWGPLYPKGRDFYLLEHVMLLTNLAAANIIYNRDWNKQEDSIQITATGFPDYASLRGHAKQALDVYKKGGGKSIPTISEAVGKVSDGWRNAIVRRLLGNPSREKLEWDDQITISEERMLGVLWLSLPYYPATHTACGIKYFPHDSFLVFDIPEPYEHTDYKHIRANYAIPDQAKAQSEELPRNQPESLVNQLNAYLKYHYAGIFLDKALLPYHPLIYREVSPQFFRALSRVSQTLSKLCPLVYPPEREKISDDDVRVLQKEAAETIEGVALLPLELRASIQKAMKLALTDNVQWWLNRGPSLLPPKEKDKAIQATIRRMVSGT